MTIPINNPAPDSERQTEIVTKADDEQLEKVRQHALETMFVLSQAVGTVPPEYAIWGAFVGKIEAEQRKRSKSV
jgi:hypothetical protein